MEAEVERSLYLKWLSDTYGKIGVEKFGEWLVTEDGRHAALDSIGFFLDPADAVNAVLHLMEGDLGNAGLSGISVLLWIGDYLGGGGKREKIPAEGSGLNEAESEKEGNKGVR